MKLGTKLLLAPVLTAAVALLSGGLNAVLMQRDAQQNAQDFNSHLDNLRSISSAQEQLGQIHAAVYRTVMLSSSLDETAIQAQRKQLQQQVTGVTRVAQAMDKGGSADVSGLLGKYGAQADQAIDLASVDINTGAAALQTADDIFKQLSQAMTGQVDATQQASQMAMGEAAAAARLRSWVLMLVGLGATLGVLLFSARMLRAVAQSLRQATELSQAVAEGDLSTQVSTTRTDEIGQLLQALGRMVRRLNSSMETVREVADSIANAGSEIASGNQDLSHRTEQAAGNLQQTASSMQQLTETVHHSADAANQATHLASTASSVALRGGEAVTQVVLTMEQINQASRKIGDIIGIIDGIAFQTNILALNAAVEAARAGEQGRGFAVVASEVRSLAGRSAEAAREIKSLVTASVERVDSGSQQAQAAGATMAEIMASVQSVSDIINRISSSAAEQSQGIGEINGAIGQLDQMTQQNAALVEQSAASSEHLKTQAQALTSLVAEFRLREPCAA